MGYLHNLKLECKSLEALEVVERCQNASDICSTQTFNLCGFKATPADQWTPPIPWEEAELSPTEWTRIQALLPDQRGQRGRPRSIDNDFRFLNGICWIQRTGAPWREMPKRFGSKDAVFSRFNRWTKADIWEGIFRAIQREEEAKGAIDWSLHHIDSTTCKAHADSAGARHGTSRTPAEARAYQCIGKSRGGLTTKLHMRCEGGGKPMVLHLTVGQRHDTVIFPILMNKGAVLKVSGQTQLRPHRLAADKAYGSKKNRKFLRSKGVGAVIPYKKNQRNRRPYDKEAYKKRNIVERAFGWFKRYRRLATRYEKLAENFMAFWVISSIRIWIQNPFVPT